MSQSFPERTSYVSPVNAETYHSLRETKLPLFNVSADNKDEPVLKVGEFYRGLFEVEGDDRWYALSIPIMMAQFTFLSKIREATAEFAFLTPDDEIHFTKSGFIDRLGYIRLNVSSSILGTRAAWHMGFLLERALDPRLAALEAEIAADGDHN